MKNTLGVVVIALLAFGVVAGSASPTHPNHIVMLSDGSSPVPLCDPYDTTCDPGPALPKPTPRPAPAVASDGSSPVPLCDPYDTTCDPGPTLPKPTPRPAPANI